MSTAQSTINVGAIERELTALWKQASEDDDGGVVRASILNLIVFNPDPAEVGQVDDMLIDITAGHPCRVISIVADRNAAEGTLTAEVTSRCSLPTPTSKQVCCEQVTITASPDHLDETPSAVVPLLIADLPVYLWWRAVPIAEDKQLFGRLVEVADRVVIDSSQFNDPRGDLSNIAKAMRDKTRYAPMSDLNWARLTAWRALVAGFYDVPEYRASLDKLSHVVIKYAPPAADETAIATRALLLGGWLASRLGWQVKEGATKRADKSTTFELTKGGRTLALEFAHTERAIEPGHLAFVTLTADDDSGRVFSVRRSADGTRIETSVTQADEKKAQRVLSYENLDETALVGRELEILGHDRMYEQAVLAAGELINS